MLLSHILSLIGCALTGLQTFLILYRGNGLCFNEGCEIVDSLSLLPPLYFNVVGFLFFLFISFGISQARKGSELWQRFTSLLLLAAIAAEAVLICFQFFITEVFCSYCLIIFSLVVLANVFMGLRQIFRSIVIFSAVCMAFASLNFSSGQQADFSLDEGIFATYSAENSDRELYLFFSSSCPHCEDVIEVMKEGITCGVKFNPVDRIESLTFPNITIADSFQPQANVQYLKNLGITEVPAMASIEDSSITVLKGAKAIVSYLEQSCVVTATEVTTGDDFQQETDRFSFPVSEPDGCSVEENCEEPTGSYPLNEQSSYEQLPGN